MPVDLWVSLWLSLTTVCTAEASTQAEESRLQTLKSAGQDPSECWQDWLASERTLGAERAGQDCKETSTHQHHAAAISHPYQGTLTVWGLGIWIAGDILYCKGLLRVTW